MTQHARAMELFYSLAAVIEGHRARPHPASIDPHCQLDHAPDQEGGE